jgi:hypothetical protein
VLKLGLNVSDELGLLVVHLGQYLLAFNYFVFIKSIRNQILEPDINVLNLIKLYPRQYFMHLLFPSLTVLQYILRYLHFTLNPSPYR